MSKRHSAAGKGKTPTDRKNMPSERYKEPLNVLTEVSDDLEEWSQDFRRHGIDMSPDKLRRILSGEVKSTSGIPCYPEVFVYSLVDDQTPKLDVAVDALVNHELIAMARQQNNRPMLGGLLHQAESLYRRERAGARGFVAHMLDYVQMVVLLIKVTDGFVIFDDLGPDADYEALRLIRRAAKLGDAAIAGLRAQDGKAEKFFLVRAIENHMVVSALLDERSSADAPHGHLKAFAASVCDWAYDVLMANARKTKNPHVAWNASELAGAAGKSQKAEEALELLFSIRAPKDGAVSLADDQENLIVDEYVVAAFASALANFNRSE